MSCARSGPECRERPPATGPGRSVHRPLHASSLREASGCVVWRDRIEDDERVRRQGVACSTVHRALLHETDGCGAPRRGRRRGHGRGGRAHLDPTDAALPRRSPRSARTTLALRALDLADEHSRSPAESRLRLIWVLDARLPRPFCNRPVYSLDGRLVPDLLDVEAGIVGEYDGADHRRRGRHASDVRREDLFRRHGLEYFKVVGPDLRDLGLVVDRMRATRQRAAWAPVAERRWTTQGPPAA